MAGGHGEGIAYKGLTMHKPKRWHTVTGKGLCAVMWFWVLYRAKQDGPVVLVRLDSSLSFNEFLHSALIHFHGVMFCLQGWRHPWEGHDDHGHGHGH
ncbi:NADH dehydrogenase [Populus alba x Populus x berolinensis]|nr:NADH dehydrogenase [Populus alba x Populus x berolinensis]